MFDDFNLQIQCEEYFEVFCENDLLEDSEYV